MDRSPFLAAFISDEPVAISKVWHVRGEPIDEATYKFMCADAQWCRQHAPELPFADPYRPIDLAAMPPVYQKKVR